MPRTKRFTSSSRPRKQSEDSKPIFKTCPTCGSRGIKQVATDYVLQLKNKRVVVPHLERHECPVCGEVLFDYEAMKRLEAHWVPRRRYSRSA